MRFDKVYNKTIEELVELAAVMIQQRNKRYRNYTKKIEEEIADVYFWLDKLKERFNKNKVKKQISYKRRKNKIK
jgi:NTP pyrophosphatase (non-canonical NTP hydrolase)